MRRLITTGNVSTQSWPSTDTAVKIQAKSSTPSSAPTSATITFCPAGIALGDMLVAENRDSLSSIFVSKSELQYTYTAQSGEVEIANTGNLVLWPDEKVYYGNPNDTGNEIVKKSDILLSSSDLSFTKTSSSIRIHNANSSYPILNLSSYGEVKLSSQSRPTISYNGQPNGSNYSAIATLGDIQDKVSDLGYTNDGSNIVIATDSTDTDAGVVIQGTDFVEIADRSGGEGVFIGRSLSGGLADVYLGNDTVEANKVASKGYVDSQVSPAGSLIIVGELNANANKVASFTQGGPLSSYSEYLNHNTLTFSNSNAVTNLTGVIYSGSSYGTGYIHRGYAFVVTTAGTIEGTSLAVGDLVMFYNDYPNSTLDSTFKWRKL